MSVEIKTYQDLVEALLNLSDVQRAQPIQIADSPNDGSPVGLSQAIAIGTVGAFEFDGARSIVDNKYHAEEIVILIDANPFDESGAIAYQMKWHETEGHSVCQSIPIYGKEGPTSREDQRAPVAAGEVPAHVLATVVRRSAKAISETVEA